MLNLKDVLFRRVLVFVVAAFLLATQFSLLRHQVQLEKHKSDNCEWCLMHAHLGDASPVASLPPFLPHVPDVVSVLVALVILAFAGTPYQVRAPPTPRPQ